MIAVNNISVTYPDGTKAIRDVSFTINDGESVALIGANGAGKTTLLLSLVGVLKPYTGTISVDGITLERQTLNEVRRRVGMVFQNPDDQLFMPMINDDIAFGPRNLGLSEDIVEDRVNSALSELGIGHLRGRSSLRLSSGEKRIAAIATVLSMNPTMMIFDEPTAFLDPKSRRGLIKLLSKLPHGRLIATHDLAFADEVCPRTVLMKYGTIFADGKTRELIYDARIMDECGIADTL